MASDWWFGATVTRPLRNFLVANELQLEGDVFTLGAGASAVNAAAKNSVARLLQPVATRAVGPGFAPSLAAGIP